MTEKEKAAKILAGTPRKKPVSRAALNKVMEQSIEIGKEYGKQVAKEYTQKSIQEDIVSGIARYIYAMAEGFTEGPNIPAFLLKAMEEGLIPAEAALSYAYKGKEEEYKELAATAEESLQTRKKPCIEELEAMKEKIQEALDDPEGVTESTLERLQDSLFSMLPVSTKDTGLAFINQSPIAKKLVKGEHGEIIFGIDTKSGKPAKTELIEGALTPYQRDITECVSKYKLDGQVFRDGSVWFTLGQLYRDLRHGAGSVSPSKKQKEDLLQELKYMETIEIHDKHSSPMQLWYGLEDLGGWGYVFKILKGRRLRFYGQEETVIVLKTTDYTDAYAERLGYYERPSQEVKAIQEYRYILKLKEPVLIKGKKVRSRSFSSNEERKAFCRENGITTKNINTAESVEGWTPWTLNRTGIALRSVLLDFVYGYIRARADGSNSSNKMRYDEIFRLCEINTDERKAVSRAKEDIAVIMNHLIHCKESCGELRELKDWKEYKNKGSKQADGIQIAIQLPEIGG